VPDESEYATNVDDASEDDEDYDAQWN
jgi:hypothetical protein